jgi:hypothetical protein
MAKSTAKPVAKAAVHSAAAVKKPAAVVEKKHQSMKSENHEKSKCEDFMFCMLRARGFSDLAIIVLKIIIFGTIISLAFSYGGDNVGVVTIGAIVAAYGAIRHKMHQNEEEHKPTCSICFKTLILNAVIGGFSTWICMLIGAFIAGESGYVIGIIVGITVALKISAMMCKKA